jgi:hypothetical protein
MDLMPETAFGYAMHFLFTPCLETLAIAEETWQEIWLYVSERKHKLVPLLADFGSSKYATELLIGVQVRLGDFVLRVILLSVPTMRLNGELYETKWYTIICDL